MKYYQCLAMYAHVVYYYNHQDEENTAGTMDGKASQTALEQTNTMTYISEEKELK